MAFQHRFCSANTRSRGQRFAACRLAGGFLLTALVGLPACNNQALYEVIRQNRLQECETRPIPQQESCKAAHQTDYEEYRRERENSRQQ